MNPGIPETKTQAFQVDSLGTMDWVQIGSRSSHYTYPYPLTVLFK